ncbi:MAG: flagellar protein FliS [Butyrivibrio sp.]|nr:flagellar protein FliS [Butyrivibrio sp.]
MTQEKKQEYTRRITQANKTQMITILYEMVLDYLADSLDAISLGKKQDAEKYLSYAQGCIDELIHSVNLEVELGRMLHKIYIFSKKELTMAAISYSQHRIWRVEKNFKSLKDAYVELEKADNSAPTMGNTQTVYAGLTYGKYSLNEDVASASLNRGLMA